MSTTGSPARERFDLRTTPLSGVCLIEASAGTGKTHALSGLFVRLLVERRLSVKEVLVVTFTEAATAELRERIRGLLASSLRFVVDGGPPIPRYPELDEVLARNRTAPGITECLRDAVRSFDEAEISTIHGFCASVLAQSAFESGAGFSVELVPDQRDLEQEVTDDFWRTRVLSAPESWLRLRRPWGRFRGGPEGLLPLLGRRSLDPALRVLPDDAEPDLGALEAPVLACFDELKRLWSREAERVRGILLNDPHWNGTTLRVARRVALLDAAAELFAREDPWSAAPLHLVCGLAAESLAGKVKKGKEAPRHELFARCDGLARAVAALDEGLIRFEHSLERSYLSYAVEELRARKGRRGLRSYDDLLAETYRALDGEGGAELASRLGARYRAALIDEFQDTDPLQYRIFLRAFGEGTLYLIGDPKQAIYGFRGADIYAYLEASRQAARKLYLAVNWRAVPELVEAVNALFGGHRLPFIHPGIDFQGADATVSTAASEGSGQEGADPALFFLLDEGDEQLNKGAALRVVSEAVSRTVLRLLGEGCEPRSVAVLVRSNRQARAVQAALRACGVPGVLYTADSVFASDEAAEVERVLAALAHPGSELHLRAALCTRMLGLDAAGLDGLDAADLDRRAERFQVISALWRERGLMRALRALLDEEGVRERMLGLPDGERRLTNVLHLVELLHLAEGELHLGVEELEGWLGERRASGGDGEAAELRLETDEDAVTIATIHHAKGLEYEVVLCPFLWDGVKPDKTGVVTFHDEEGIPVLDLEGGASGAERSFQEELAEGMRLVYVALTRAKRACYVYWGCVNEAETSPLFYLLHCRDMGPEKLGEAGGLRAALKARWDSLTPGALRKEVAELAASVGGAVALRPFDRGAAPALRAEAGEPVGEARVFDRTSWGCWGITSYTGLTRGHHREGVDRDRDAAPAEAPPPESGGGIIGFPRGAAAGSFIHALLEQADFGAAWGTEAEDLLAERCREWGYDASWAPALVEMVRQVVSTPLPGGEAPVRLSGVGRRERLTELEFYLPVDRLDPLGLARAFEASSPPFRGAAPALATLGFGEIRGFLQGFIDLVFRSGDRYYIVDWKSNYLGPTGVHYGTEALGRAMAENRYGLQLALYSVALHLYLSRRVPSYEYERGFGGVFYLFVRGMRADAPEQGVYFARPPLGLVGGLAEALRGASHG